MCNVAHKVIQLSAVAEALVTTAGKCDSHQGGEEVNAEPWLDCLKSRLYDLITVVSAS